MRRKGFTLIELLVVIATIALLMAILMPALARVRVIANMVACGSHLKDIGNGIFMYAQENNEKYPKAGLRGVQWSSTGTISQWNAQKRADAFAGEPSQATISSSLYLLIKYGSCTPSLFVCNSDGDTEEFKIQEYNESGQGGGGGQSAISLKLDDAWDFGPQPGLHCSYSYHMPYSFSLSTGGADTSTTSYALNASCPAVNPLCADRNPFLDKDAEYAQSQIPGETQPYLDNSGQFKDPDGVFNSAAHQRSKQNVLYNDGHVIAEPLCTVGYEDDNIWQAWPGVDASREQKILSGIKPTQGDAQPKHQDDACLVNDDNSLYEN